MSLFSHPLEDCQAERTRIHQLFTDGIRDADATLASADRRIDLRNTWLLWRDTATTKGFVPFVLEPPVLPPNVSVLAIWCKEHEDAVSISIETGKNKRGQTDT